MSASDRDAETDEPRPIVHEVPSAVSPYIRRIVAANPSATTGAGTNTYLAGVDEIAIIDPGPDTDEHLDAVAGCGGDRIRWILLTHTSPSHALGAARLAKRTGAEVCAFDGRDVRATRFLADGEAIDTSEFRLRVVHTPGHASNHLCFLLEEERTLFTGDHVIDGAHTMVAPPDGDMAAYLHSLRAVAAIKRLRSIAPGHGHVITDPVPRIEAIIEHRLACEAMILAAVQDGASSIDDILARVPESLGPDLLPDAAPLMVDAHLRKLAAERRVTLDGDNGAWLPA